MAAPVEWSEGYVEANGLEVHYFRSGAGSGKPAILLLHGITDNARCWPLVAEELAADYDVVTTDARGHGRTQGDVSNFSIPLLADDAAALISALGLQRPYVWGHSMGGITAATLAANYPDLLRAVVLEDPPFIDRAPAPMTKQETRERIAAHERFAAELEAASPEERLQRGKADNPSWDDAEIEPWVESKMQFNPALIEARARAFDNYPWRELLARIQCPVLLITGDPEVGALITPEKAAEAMRLTRQGQLLQLSGAGHSIHRERFPQTMTAVRTFL